ncbi:MAG: ABC transporter ATP-binding protein [Planctomycetes bacterium]|nr:ABC transporter ATP-binding protein [Planctomycetota bacterium]
MAARVREPSVTRRPDDVPAIELVDVHKSFGNFDVLRGITFSVPRGKTFVIMGGSGTGKSVTLKHIIGIVQPDSGDVLVDGESVPRMDRKGLMHLRKRMGYLFQDGALINWMTIFDNVALPLRENTRMSKSEIEDRTMEVCELVDLAHSIQKFPANISGGMKKRAGLARTLVTEPEVVLYDEPNAGLDPVMSDKINQLILEVQERFQVTSVVVTHKRACAYTTGDMIALIKDGVIVEQGTRDYMRASDHPLVRAFLGGID